MIPLRVIEIIWLVVAIVSLILGIYQSSTIGLLNDNTYWFFICTFIAAMMYSFRRTQRMKYQQDKEDKKTKLQ